MARYNQKQLGAALKLFGMSARLFNNLPNGKTGKALSLSYSGIVLSEMKDRTFFHPKPLALLFSEGAMQTAQGMVGADNDIVHRNH